MHGSPGADHLWSRECLYASIDITAGLIKSARTGRDWGRERYGLDRQPQARLRLLVDLT
jgi:hypothetical protein